MQDQNNLSTECCEDGMLSAHPQQQSSQGTLSSNTVPPTCIDNTSTRIIRTGIDSLYLSYEGDLSEENHIRLKELKKLAQAQESSLSSLAQISLSDHLFEVKDRGRHPFAYILVDNHYRIEVSSLGAKRLPLAHIQISSELLTQCGADLSVESLNGIVQSLGLVDGDPSVSRADLCVDFVTNFPLHQITDENWVTRAQNMNRYLDTRRFSGWSIGAGSIKARLYNKSLELQKKPRPYLHSLYEALGVNDNEQVWRLEFELRRETLRQLQVTSFAQLVSSLAGLWIYATHD